MAHLITPDGQIRITRDEKDNFNHFISKDGIKWYVEKGDNNGETLLFAYTHDKPYLKDVELHFDWDHFVTFWESTVSEKLNGFTSKSEDWYEEVRKRLSEDVLRDYLVTFCENEYELGNYEIKVV